MKNLRGIIAKALVILVYVIVFIWAALTGKGYLLFVDNKARDGVYTFSIKLDKATSVTVPAGSVKSVYVKGSGNHHITVTKGGSVIFEGTVAYPKSTVAAMIDGAMIDSARTNGDKVIHAQAVSETMYEEPEKSADSAQEKATETSPGSETLPVNP